jgi:hypothetical protein
MQAAKDLECDASHLRRVLIGQRVSQRLTSRYNAWLKNNSTARGTVTSGAAALHGHGASDATTNTETKEG